MSLYLKERLTNFLLNENMAASASNSNPLLEHLEDGKNYDLEFGDTWNSTIDGSNSKYSYHTIKCNE